MLMIELSNRVKRIKPSPTLAMNAKAMALKAQGQDIISLSIGEPDFDTPEPIKQAAILAIQQGFTKYTAVEGIVELRQAIITKFSRENQLFYNLKQILVSSGGKQSFFNLAQALLNENDEVIIPAPYWVSYPDMVLLADAKPVIIEAGIEQGFKITAQQLENAITAKTRLFVINSPSNPTGIAYSQKELEALSKILLKYPNILIATDDMYEHILWQKEPELKEPFCNILNVCPELYDRTIVLNGVSKAYSMTGWRIGYCAGPEALINAMNNVQNQSTSNACSISQKAALAALTGDQSSIPVMVKAFKERHDFVVDALNKMHCVECLAGDGTFYAFARVEGAIARLGQKDDVVFSEFLLEKAGVAVVPGSAFGAPGYIRLSFSTSMDNLREAMARMKRVIG